MAAWVFNAHPSLIPVYLPVTDASSHAACHLQLLASVMWPCVLAAYVLSGLKPQYIFIGFVGSLFKIVI